MLADGKASLQDERVPPPAGKRRRKQLPNDQSNRGGSDEQHAKPDQKSPTDARNGAGRGWHGDPQGHAEVGRKGGEVVSQNREHMAAIGRKGGEAVSKDRKHMANIGREGGEARGQGGNRGKGIGRDKPGK